MASATTPAKLEAISKLAASMRRDLQDFWLEHGTDQEFGGFHGTVERLGLPGDAADKGVVQQARHCWAFSHAYSNKMLKGRAAAAAKEAWGFMTDHMLRADDATWRFVVARDGAPTNGSDDTHLYSTFFAIYAATAYARAFSDEGALQLALATFSSMDASHHDDAAGGFNEDSCRPILHQEVLQAASDGGAAQLPRTLNIFLHGTEALAALYEASGDEAVLARLLEMLRIICEKMVTKDNVMYEYYDPNGWKPFGPPSVNWGHNLESAWIVSTVVDSLVAKGRLPAATADRWVSTLMAVAARSLREGFDAAHGGMYEAGVPGAPPGVGKGASTDKVWWVQCESMLAMWEVYRRTGDCGALDKLQATLQFVHDHMRDPEDKEWVWSTDATGTKLGVNKWQKGNHWKATYHSTRALMFLEEWIGAAAT